MEGVKVAIHQPEHFPYMGFFQKMEYADVFVILDDVQYSKGNWQNRNRFLNKNDTLLRLYKDASTQGRRFIKKQYNALTPNKVGYYSFFKRIDEELEKEENS